MARLRILTLISVLLSVMVFLLKNKKPSTLPAAEGLAVNKSWLTINSHPLTPARDVRPPDQTFLTFPEWFLVFSPAEQADYFKLHTSTTFPYMKHVDQLWKGYDLMYHQVKGNYPFNTGYHVMIMVIAGSTTIEYGLKSGYETIIGRLTEPEHAMTEEDQFDQHYMADYTRFIEDTPWYEYNFNHQLKNLWAGTSFWGPHFLRKFERKYFLTTELLIKSGYGWLIKQGTKASYDQALLNTKVITDTLPPNIVSGFPIKNTTSLKNGGVMADLPRYAKFNQAANLLASKGINFREIAGNRSAIMLTILTHHTLTAQPGFTVLFTQPIATQPNLNRVALATPVASLSSTVRWLRTQQVTIEHIYDY